MYSDEMIYGIYAKETLIYVGMTKMTLPQRIGKHQSEARKGRGSLVGSAIRAANFEIVAKILSNDHSDEAEKSFILNLKPTCNQQEGGKKNFTPWNKGKSEHRPEVIENIKKSAAKRLSPKRGSYSSEHKAKIGSATKSRTKRPFICLNTGKVYENKVDAAKELGLNQSSLSVLLSGKSRLKTLKGFRFKYIEL